MKYLSVNMILLFGCLYHIFSSRLASNVSPFVSAIVTYFFALLLNIILFIIFGKNNFINEFHKINKYSIFLGLITAMYDMGFILAYRNGWITSKLQPIATIGITALTIFVSVIFYKQKIDIINIIGFILLAGGIVLVLK